MPERGTRRKVEYARKRITPEIESCRKEGGAGKREMPESDARSVRLADGCWYRPETSVDVYGLVPSPTGMEDRSQTPSTDFRHPSFNHCHNRLGLEKRSANGQFFVVVFFFFFFCLVVVVVVVVSLFLCLLLLPPTSAIIDYAIGLEKLSANGQFFCFFFCFCFLFLFFFLLLLFCVFFGGRGVFCFFFLVVVVVGGWLVGRSVGLSVGWLVGFLLSCCCFSCCCCCFCLVLKWQ